MSPLIALRRFRDALVDLTLNARTWHLELWLATTSWLWGMWLLAPWDAFGHLPMRNTVLQTVPESVWGAVFAAHGVAHMVLLARAMMASGPEGRKRVRWCARAALGLSFLWSLVLGGFLATVPLSVATPLYAMFVLGCLWVHRRLHWRFG